MRPSRNIGLLLVLMTVFQATDANAQIGGKAGAFSRMGFGARGIGLGNAMTAVSSGDVVGYYNPAALPFAPERNVAATFGILSLDRRLNFLSFTQPLRPSAGLAFGIINSGVSDIDGRDSDGEPTGMLNTSENQIFLAFANQFKGGLSLGINIKLYYHRLYTDVTSTTVGVDFGAMLKLTDALTIGACVRDVNSQYKWDTSELYGQSGNTTNDKFPLLYSFGTSYNLPDSIALVVVDVEASNQSTLIVRAGIEAPLLPELILRAGIDRMDIKDKGNGVKPSFGFTIRKGMGDWIPALSYVYVIEPFSSSGIHLISLSVVL